jgi:DNA polymerase-3 subunit gamma/tau
MAGDPSVAAADPSRREAPPGPTALYRRYRPATFAELKGQDHVTEPLRQALRSGRVHHAYLFSGPRGCGKTSSARILARSLNCEQGPTPDPCGVCASCVALAPSGPGSIDVIEIDAASHGGVDDARDLRERAFYAPVAGRFKIYIVDEAHMVTREGFNALLKLVEEPPSHLKFVFATTEPEKVIATIRSRTHHYPFRLMPPAVLRALLEEILGAEGVQYEPAVLPVVIRAGAGSARDTLSILDQLLAGSGDEGLTYERAVALLGYTDESLLDEVSAAFANGDGAAVFRAVDRVVEAGHDPRRFAADLLDRIRDLIVLAAVPDAAETGLLDIPDDRLERMREQAASFGQAELTSAAEIINTGLVEMRGATSPRLQLELICAQVLLPAPDAGQGALLARLERLERRLASGTGDAGPPPVTADRRDAPAAARSAPDQTEPERGIPGPSAARPAAVDPGPDGRPAREPAPERAAAGRGRTEPAARPPAAHAAGGAASAGPVGAEVLRERWPEILDAVKSRSRVAWMLLHNATVDTLAEGVLTLRFAKEGEARGFSGSNYAQDLSQVLETMLGISPRIRAIAGASGGSDGAGGPGGSGGASGPGGSGGASGPGGNGGAGGSGPGGPGTGGSGPGGADTGGPASSAAGDDWAARRGGDRDGERGPDAAGRAPAGAAGHSSDRSAGHSPDDSSDYSAGRSPGRSAGHEAASSRGAADGEGRTGSGPGGTSGGAGPGSGPPTAVSAAVSAAAASARAAATARSGARSGAKRAASPGFGAPADPDEEWPDDEGSEPAGPDHTPGGAQSGLGLIQRTLGGEVIAELGRD